MLFPAVGPINYPLAVQLIGPTAGNINHPLAGHLRNYVQVRCVIWAIGLVE